MQIITANPERFTGDTKNKQQTLSGAFDYPVAQTTEWVGVSMTSSNFRSHFLRINAKGQLVVARSIKTGFGYFLFALVGYALLALTIAGATRTIEGSGINHPVALIFISLFGLIFAFIGTGSLFFDKMLVFDKYNGFCWVGRNMPNSTKGVTKTRGSVEYIKKLKLDRFSAIQILKKSARNSRGYFKSYELNLILDDGARLGVLNHMRLKHLRADAEKLSEYLKIPVLDVVELQESHDDD